MCPAARAAALACTLVHNVLSVAPTWRGTLQASCAGKPKQARTSRYVASCKLIWLLSLPCAKAERLTKFSASREASWVWRNARNWSGVVCSLSLAVMVQCIQPVYHTFTVWVSLFAL